MENQSTAKHIITSFLILVVAVIVIVAIGIGFGAIGIPLWPFILFLFLYAGIDKFDARQLPWTALSGAIGIFAGMAQGVFGELTGIPEVGLAVFAVSAAALATAFIMGNVKWANLTGLLLMTVLTLFQFDPALLAGVAGAGWVSAFLRAMASYLIAVIVFFIVGKVMAARAVEAPEAQPETQA